MINVQSRIGHLVGSRMTLAVVNLIWLEVRVPVGDQILNLVSLNNSPSNILNLVSLNNSPSNNVWRDVNLISASWRTTKVSDANRLR